MPRGKPARKRPAASASAERQPAQSTKRRHTGRSTANPVPAVEDNINAVSNSAPATNDATDAVCTPSLDSASVNGPGSSIQGSTAVLATSNNQYQTISSWRTTMRLIQPACFQKDHAPAA